MAFVRTTTNEQTGRRNADIWVVPGGWLGAAAGCSFGGESSELTPTCSPDSKRIAFVSTRGGAPQVFDRAGATAASRGKSRSWRWACRRRSLFSPDGARVAFVSDVYPECPDEACNARTRGGGGEEPGQGAPREAAALSPLVRVAREHPPSRASSPRSTAAKTVDVTPGDFDSPPYFYEDGALAFSPDGKQIAFVSNREGNDVEAWTTNQDVWIVPVTGGAAPKRLTHEQGGGCAAGVDAPMDRRSCCAANGGPNFESDRWYLDVYDVASGQRQTVFESPDLSVEDFALAPDGRSILFTAQDRGVVNVYSVPYPSGTPRVVTRGGAIVGLDAGRDFAVDRPRAR